MTPKWPRTLQGQSYPIRVPLVPQALNSTLFHSTIIYSHFQDICNFFIFPLATMLHFNSFFFFNFKIQNSKEQIFIWTVNRNSCKRFGCKRIISVEDAAFWKPHFRKYRKCTNWPQNDLERYKPKGTPYVELLSVSPKFHSIFLYDRSFSR